MVSTPLWELALAPDGEDISRQLDLQRGFVQTRNVGGHDHPLVGDDQVSRG
jgi:hypothetical protein